MTILKEATVSDGDEVLFLFDNKLTHSGTTISTDREDPDHPLVNIKNPATNLFYRETTGGVLSPTITIDFDSSEEVDTIAIQGHNCYNITNLFTISCLYQNDNGTFRETEETIYSYSNEPGSRINILDNRPIIFRIEKRKYRKININFLLASGFRLQVANIFAGVALKMPRGVYVGHKPITYARESNIVTGKSESGQFLGRIVVGETYQNEFRLSNIEPDFFRQEIAPFFDNADENPFFMAWRPDEYSSETAYCWSVSNMNVINQLPNGMVEIDFTIQADTKGIPKELPDYTLVSDDFSTETNRDDSNSSGYIYVGSEDVYKNSPLYEDGGLTSDGNPSHAAHTFIDRSFTLDVGKDVTRIGVYSDVAQAMKVKIARRNSPGVYSIVRNRTLNHTGSGFEDYEFDSAYTIPDDGFDYFIGVYSPNAIVRSNELIPRAFANADPTGTLSMSEGVNKCYLTRVAYANNITLQSNAFSTSTKRVIIANFFMQFVPLSFLRVPEDITVEIARKSNPTEDDFFELDDLRLSNPNNGIYTLSQNEIYLEGDVDFNILYRIKTKNNRAIEIHSVTIGYIR